MKADLERLEIEHLASEAEGLVGSPDIHIDTDIDV